MLIQVRNIIIGGAIIVSTITGLSYAVGTSNIEGGGSIADQILKNNLPSAPHLKMPDAVKAIYMSQCVVGTPTFRDSLVTLIDTTELNSVVIDIKDYSGTIGFPTIDERFKEASMKSCGAYDMKEFIATLHEKDIYVIGRITVFQDPFYTKAFPEQAVQSISRNAPWKDNKGLSFVDVSSKPYWDYIVELSKESYAIGFDELNYDYIRYPSDGPMKDASYVDNNKPEALERFFQYLHAEIKPIGAVMSADLFGMTTTNNDDLNIGQQLERTLPYFDYIAPMVYPSHYPKGFHNLGNPNDHVYEVVNYSMAEAVRRTIASTTPVAWSGGVAIASTSPQLYTKKVYPATVMRPWLQDFDYGGDYGSAEVRAQIQATYDAGLTSWMLWAPSNRYTKEALETE